MSNQSQICKKSAIIYIVYFAIRNGLAEVMLAQKLGTKDKENPAFIVIWKYICLIFGSTGCFYL